MEALEEKGVYGELELLGGRLARIIKGDLIAGVLGERQALKGFVGSIPAADRAGRCAARPEHGWRDRALPLGKLGLRASLCA